MGSAPSKPTSASQPQNEKDALVAEQVKNAMANMSIAPASADGTLSLSNLSTWEGAFETDPKLKLARDILSHSDIRSALLSRSAQVINSHIFNHALDFKTGPVTNQKSSGRCWLFATTNVLRYDIMKKLKLKEFQLSQSYLFFYDKLNKSNYYLELSIENANLPLDDRLVDFLSDDLISDGGQWDMVVNILETYGMVPHPIYPESTHSSLSSPLNDLLKKKLREHALILRKLFATLHAQGVSNDVIISAARAKKEELLGEIYTIMSATLGQVPKPDENFTWDYYTEDGKAGSWTGTPLEFYKAFASKTYPVVDSFSLINDPRNEYGKLYTVDKLGNVWGGRQVLYVNTDIEDLKNAVVSSIKAGVAVFFGCDVGQSSNNAHGIMDTSLFEYESAFGIKLGLTKAERLQVNESSMTHAMVISAVHLDSKTGKPIRYRVENSWGDAVGDKGYFVMSDAWFEQYVYQVVINKALAPKRLVQIFESGDKTVLPPWDPMGSLA